MENVGYTSTEWLAELQAQSPTELEKLIAAAMAMEAATGDNDISASGVAEDTETQWVLPEAANMQLRKAQKDAEETLQMSPPVTVAIDHEVSAHRTLYAIHCSALPCCYDLVANHVRRWTVEPLAECPGKAPRPTHSIHGDVISLRCSAKLWRCKRCLSLMNVLGL